MIGLLTWLLVAPQLIPIAAELNVVLTRGLRPRSLTGDLLAADKHALRAVAHASQLDPRQNIAVRFEHNDDTPNPPDAREDEPAMTADQGGRGQASGGPLKVWAHTSASRPNHPRGHQSPG